MTKQQYTIIVKGRVQGVGFRHFTRQIARSNGIYGWVKNLPNGDVKIHAEGEQSKLVEFIHQCQKGPSFGFVEKIDLSEEKVYGYSSFEVRL